MKRSRGIWHRIVCGSDPEGVIRPGAPHQGAPRGAPQLSDPQEKFLRSPELPKMEAGGSALSQLPPSGKSTFHSIYLFFTFFSMTSPKTY